MEQSTTKATGFFVLGAAVGAILMTLANSKNGHEMRHRMKDALRKTTSKASEGIEDAKTAVSKKIESNKTIEEI